MAKINSFKKPPRHRRRARERKPRRAYSARRSAKPRWQWGYSHAMLATMAVSIAALIGLGGWPWASDNIDSGASTGTDAATFACPTPRVVDGDTLKCGQRRVRLQGIDAPELPGHCRQGRECVPGDPYASTENLRKLVTAGTLLCRQTDIDVYGRTVARCKAGQIDLSCAQIEGGFAIKRYALIYC